MNEPVTLSLTETDLVHAYRLRYRRPPKWRIGLMIGISALMGLWFAWEEGLSNLMTTLIYIAAGMGFGVILYTLILLFYHLVWFQRIAAKIFRQQKDLGRNLQISWDDDFVSMEGKEFSGRIAFSDFLKWRADSNILILYKSDNLLHLMPVRFFRTSEQLADFISKLESANVPGKQF